jgi:hypothetical protein
VNQTQIRNTFTSIGELDSSLPPTSLVLKIGLARNSFKYFIQSVAHDLIIFFGNYTLHHVDDDEELAKRIEKIVADDDALQLPFAKVMIGVDNDYNLMPEGFYWPSTNEKGISLNQKLSSCGMEMVFYQDVILNYNLKNLFPGCQILHVNSSFINVLPAYLENGPDKIFINVAANYFDFLKFNATGQLQILNRYNYKTETDFAYFLLLCCNELGVDREVTELLLCGEVDIQSKVYDMCYRYFRNVNFIKPPKEVHFAKAFERFPKHLHFNLYNLSA